MTTKLYLYPAWLRLWHWANAALFFCLIVTGISMHYAEPSAFWIPFETSVWLHNVCGIVLSMMYVLFILGNLLSGNYKHYQPLLEGLVKRIFRQTCYYLYGIFKGHPHPYHPTSKQKFNPLQQLTYLNIMYLLLPILIGTGWFLLFPETAPDQVLGAGGIWPMALAHSAAGFAGSLFMVGHIYLATTGDTILSNIRSMFTGWHIGSH